MTKIKYKFYLWLMGIAGSINARVDVGYSNFLFQIIKPVRFDDLE